MDLSDNTIILKARHDMTLTPNHRARPDNRPSWQPDMRRKEQ
jgi:hypothetical protein